MYSFFFGSSDRKLYGALESAGSSRAGVLICGAWGLEAQASHYFLRVISKRLAASGLSAMRFDYGGSGDSYGEERDSTLATMTADTQSAVEELREVPGVDSLCLVGYRLGALPALRAARQSRCSVVLLDPVLDGPQWLRQLEASRWAAELDDSALEVGGFIMGKVLRETLASGSPLVETADVARVVAAIVSQDSGCPGIDETRVQVCTAPPTWHFHDGVGKATIPPHLVDTVVERILGFGSAEL